MPPGWRRARCAGGWRGSCWSAWCAAGWPSIRRIMLEKGRVSRTAAGRGHRYAARVAQGEVRRRLAGELLERVFGGSVAALVQSALATRPASAAELREVEELLEQAAAGEAGADAGEEA